MVWPALGSRMAKKRTEHMKCINPPRNTGVIVKIKWHVFMAYGVYTESGV